MSFPHEQGASRGWRAPRPGKTFTFTLIAICLAIGLGLAGWFLFRRGTVVDSPELVTTAVWKGPYEFAVIEQGTVESASNTEIRSYVHSRSGSTTILSVVPEGTIVKEGDLVVELDSSGLLLEENAQQILVSTRESLLAEAENTLKAAKIAKTEYLEGLYVSQEKDLLSLLFIADRAKSMAESALESAKVLHTKGIVAALQVDAAHATLQDALNQYDAAQTNLNTLRNLTKEKEATLLEAGIASAEAHVKAHQKSLGLEENRLKDIQDQIANCTIKAPAAGQIVYANETGSFFGGSQAQFIVAPGATVRERQTIIWLPNADNMQIKAAVNEARVTMVRPGMSVSIRVDALRDDLLEGEVTKVSQFAEPGRFSSGSIKKYETIIAIKNPPTDLRVGMNAEVRIQVEQMDAALQLPVQALAESKGHYFSLVKNGDDYETREIEISSTNDKVATIEKGLAEGDEVVLNPRSMGHLLKLPDLPDVSPFVMNAENDRENTRDSTRPLPAAVAAQEVNAPAESDGKEGFSPMTPSDMVAQFLESDANRDDKLSQEEISHVGAGLKERLLTADTNGDGFLERRELLKVSVNAVRQVREKPAAGSRSPSPGEPGRRGQGEPSAPSGEHPRGV